MNDWTEGGPIFSNFSNNYWPPPHVPWEQEHFLPPPHYIPPGPPWATFDPNFPLHEISHHNRHPPDFHFNNFTKLTTPPSGISNLNRAQLTLLLEKLKQLRAHLREKRAAKITPETQIKTTEENLGNPPNPPSLTPSTPIVSTISLPSSESPQKDTKYTKDPRESLLDELKKFDRKSLRKTNFTTTKQRNDDLFTALGRQFKAFKNNNNDDETSEYN